MGDLRIAAFEMVIFAAYGAVVYLAFRFSRSVAGAGAGVAAALVVATRPGIVEGLLGSSADLLFVALVLAAIVYAVERRDERLVLGVLVLAGLVRPEGWLLSVLYGGWLMIGRRRGERHSALTPVIVLVCAAPVAWVLFDLVVTGDPLHSLTGTRELAAESGRPNTAAVGLRLLADYLFGLVTEPVAWAGALGLLASIRWAQAETTVATWTVFAATAAFLLLGLAGLPVLERYLILPATLLSVFAGIALLLWRRAEAEGRDRSYALALAGFCAIAVIVSITTAYHDVKRSIAVTHAADVALRDLEAITEMPRAARAIRSCKPLVVPTHRPLPALALFTGERVGRIQVRTSVAKSGTFLLPRVDGTQADAGLPALSVAPSGFATVASNATWRLATSCDG